MKIEQVYWLQDKGWSGPMPGKLGPSAGLVLVFGVPLHLKNRELMESVGRAYPNARVAGCSTAGEITGSHVLDNSLVVTAVQFESGSVEASKIQVAAREDSYTAGEQLAESLPAQNLVHVLTFSDGLIVNGSELVNGLMDRLPAGVKVTGGLSGDGDRFQETLVVLDGPAEKDTVIAVGLYGRDLKVGYGSLGGWDPFGPERLITKSKGNILYELDGKSALELYKQYLGKHAEGLPATGLLFPLSLRFEGRKNVLVRTILAVNESDQSLVFAGDVPEGAYARLMKANFDRLVDGALEAARSSHQTLGSISPDLAILISCVGRKMILKQRIEEEVESVREVLGEKAVFTGFYSYGEISPSVETDNCELHNQTMTITTISE